MTFSSLVRKMSPWQNVFVLTMDRDGEELELFSGNLEDCPKNIGNIEVVSIESDVLVDNEPIKNSLHGVIVITLDEIATGSL